MYVDTMLNHGAKHRHIPTIVQLQRTPC